MISALLSFFLAAAPDAQGLSPAPATAAPANAWKAPAPLLITRPDYYVNGTWGGLSDGKTKGFDGRVFADHSIYDRDTGCFDDWLKLARNKMAQQATDRLGILIEAGWAETDESRQRIWDNFAKRFKMTPQKAPEWALAQAIMGMRLAKRDYGRLKTEIEKAERIRGDYCDANDASTPEVAARRLRLRQAVNTMATSRASLHQLLKPQLAAAWPEFLAQHKDPNTYVQVAKGVQIITWWKGEPAAGHLAEEFALVAQGKPLIRGLLVLDQDAKFRQVSDKVLTLKMADGASLKVLQVEAAQGVQFLENGKSSLNVISGWIKQSDAQNLPAKK